MDILDTVTARLSALGCPTAAADGPQLRFCIKRAEAELCSAVNRPEVPEGLFYVWADMAAGRFLTDRKASGALADVYDFSAPAKSISEGDTSVAFAIADGATFETQFDAMLARLVHPDGGTLAAYRRLTW